MFWVKKRKLTSRSAELTWAKRCAPKLSLGYRWLIEYAFWPFKVAFEAIDFWKNQKSTHHFLLVIKCDLGSISQHFQDIVSRNGKPVHPAFWVSRSNGPLWISSSRLPLKQLKHCLLFSVNRVILVSAVLSQYTRVTDDDRRHYDSIRTLLCNKTFGDDDRHRTRGVSVLQSVYSIALSQWSNATCLLARLSFTP